MAEQIALVQDKLKEIKGRVKLFIDANSHLKEYLNIAHEKTKVDVEYLFIGALVIVGDVASFILPFIASIKAIETKSLDDDKQWLTYWIVFIFFKLIEGVASIFVSAIPFYFYLKFIFLFCCWHPQIQGAQKIYNSFIKLYLIPLLGLKETFDVSSLNSSEIKLPTLELTIERITLFDPSQKEIFVEVCIKPPSTRKPTGIEETIFKTESYQPLYGIIPEHPLTLLLSPLPNIDGIISFRILEKVTFGDDKLLDFREIEVRLFCSDLQGTRGEGEGEVTGEGGLMKKKISLDIGEMEIVGKYSSV